MEEEMEKFAASRAKLKERIAKERRDRNRFVRAAGDGELALVRQMVGSGVPVDATDDGEYTALLEATRQNALDVVRFLCQIGADINWQDNDGHTALHEACFNGNEDVIAALLEYGADKTIRTNNGEVALDMAVRYSGKLDIIWTLADGRHQTHGFYSGEAPQVKVSTEDGDQGVVRKAGRRITIKRPVSLRREASGNRAQQDDSESSDSDFELHAKSIYEGEEESGDDV